MNPYISAPKNPLYFSLFSSLIAGAVAHSPLLNGNYQESVGVIPLFV